MYGEHLPLLPTPTSETADPAPPLAETPQASLGPESPASTEPGNFEPENLTYTPMVAGTAIEERQAKPASTAPATPRARHARPAAQAESAQPLDPEKLWNLVPK